MPMPFPKAFLLHNFKIKYKIYTETAFSLIVVIAAIKLTLKIYQLKGAWYITPCILLGAALIPALIKKQNLKETILPFGQIKKSLTLVAITSIITLPLLFIALAILKHWPIIHPALPTPPATGQLINWLLYQFLYIATFEEIFFRAYLQSNILAAISPNQQSSPAPNEMLDKHQWIAITISSAAFTAAHIIIHEDPAQTLVFLPAMIFGYLFARTTSLIAPIIFHAISNTAYCLIANLLISP
jgi:membrane protease YdiL (CAAX protease family)